MSALALDDRRDQPRQGFPDTDGPAAMLERAVEGLRSGENQYPPGPGRAGAARRDRRAPPTPLRPVLRPGHRDPRHGRCDRGDQCRRSSRLCEPGDEVVVFEPYYDSYAAAIALAGADASRVPLRPDADRRRFSFDPDELRAADHPAHPGRTAQLPAQPDRHGPDPRRARVDRRVCIEHDLIA